MDLLNFISAYLENLGGFSNLLLKAGCLAVRELYLKDDWFMYLKFKNANKTAKCLLGCKPGFVLYGFQIILPNMVVLQNYHLFNLKEQITFI